MGHAGAVPSRQRTQPDTATHIHPCSLTTTGTYAHRHTHTHQKPHRHQATRPQSYRCACHAIQTRDVFVIMSGQSGCAALHRLVAPLTRAVRGDTTREYQPAARCCASRASTVLTRQAVPKSTCCTWARRHRRHARCLRERARTPSEREPRNAHTWRLCSHGASKGRARVSCTKKMKTTHASRQATESVVFTLCLRSSCNRRTVAVLALVCNQATQCFVREGWMAGAGTGTRKYMYPAEEAMMVRYSGYTTLPLGPGRWRSFVKEVDEHKGQQASHSEMREGGVSQSREGGGKGRQGCCWGWG